MYASATIRPEATDPSEFAWPQVNTHMSDDHRATSVLHAVQRGDDMSVHVTGKPDDRAAWFRAMARVCQAEADRLDPDGATTVDVPLAGSAT